MFSKTNKVTLCTKDTVPCQNFVATLGQLGFFITVEVNVVPVRVFRDVEDTKRVEMKVVAVYHKTAVRQSQVFVNIIILIKLYP